MTIEKVKLTADMLEEENFDDFFEELEKMVEDPDEITISPDSKIDSRKWVSAYIRLAEEIDFLKNEYIPHLTEKFIAPSKNKIERIKEQQDAIKGGLQDFLEDLGEKKINFPELGTVFLKATQKKIIYPEDESAYAEKLMAEGNKDYIVTTAKLNKKKISQEFKDTGKLPLQGVTGEEAGVSVNIRRTKVKSED